MRRSAARDRKSTRLNSSHLVISYAVFCLKKKKDNIGRSPRLEKKRVTGRSYNELLLHACLRVSPSRSFYDCAFSRSLLFFFFFNDTATTEIYTLSLHDALPICRAAPISATISVASRSASQKL